MDSSTLRSRGPHPHAGTQTGRKNI
jgi:hypothetical protein